MYESQDNYFKAVEFYKEGMFLLDCERCFKN